MGLGIMATEAAVGATLGENNKAKTGTVNDRLFDDAG
jgi:hypothetical protein